MTFNSGIFKVSLHIFTCFIISVQPSIRILIRTFKRSAVKKAQAFVQEKFLNFRNQRFDQPLSRNLGSAPVLIGTYDLWEKHNENLEG